MLRFVSLVWLLTSAVAFGGECPRAAASHVALVRITDLEVVYDGKDEATTLATVEVQRMLRGPPVSSARIAIEGGPGRDGQTWQYSVTSGIGTRGLGVGASAVFAWSAGSGPTHPIVPIPAALIVEAEGEDGGRCALNGGGRSVVGLDPWRTEERYPAPPAGAKGLQRVNCAGAPNWEAVLAAVEAQEKACATPPSGG